MSEQINGWVPPVVIGDFGHKARVVTQADVDNWVEITRKYHALLSVLDDARKIISDNTHRA